MIYYSEKTREKLDDVIGRLGKLPPLPENIARINRMIDSENTTLEAVGRQIATDYALSAQVLQLINSSFYGFSDHISSIKQAVVLLGLGVIRTLAGASWIAEMMQNSSRGLHHHSLATARTIHTLSSTLCIGEPDEMASVGLLHDVGKAMMSMFTPDNFQAIYKQACHRNLCFYEIENEDMGVNHASIGGRLLDKWNLPERVIIPVLHHHDDTLPKQYRKETALLKLADLMVRAEGCGFCGDNSMPDFGPEMSQELNIEPSDLNMLSDLAYDQMRSIPRYIGETAL
jgi:putative nucleotidyltransferase with HDIG domain